jgi:hypothetical protein
MVSPELPRFAWYRRQDISRDFRTGSTDAGKVYRYSCSVITRIEVEYDEYDRLSLANVGVSYSYPCRVSLDRQKTPGSSAESVEAIMGKELRSGSTGGYSLPPSPSPRPVN